MRNDFINSLLVTCLASAAVIFFSFTHMSRPGIIWGMYGLTAIYMGAFGMLAGIIIIFFRRLRPVAEGVLLGALLTLLIGGCICNNWIRF